MTGGVRERLREIDEGEWDTVCRDDFGRGLTVGLEELMDLAMGELSLAIR